MSTLDPKHFPPPIVERFRRDVKLTVLRSLQLTTEMLRLLKLLEDEGIATVAFKGSPLSLQAYGDIFSRRFDDIDLLVGTPDFDRAQSFLCSQGYTDCGGRSHACNLFHSERRTAVDLHRYIPGPVGFTAASQPLAMDTESLLARSGYLVFENHKIRSLQIEDLLLLLCIHGAKHAWRRWIWLFDISALITRNPTLDWDQLTQRARELSILEPVYLSLRLTETVCDSTLPPGVLQGFHVRPAVEDLILSLDSDIVQDPNPLRSDLRRYLLPFKTLTTSSDKIGHYFRLLIKRIVPTPADHALLRLPRHLRFLYFVIRPLRLLYEHGSNVAGYVVSKLRLSRRHTTKADKP